MPSGLIENEDSVRAGGDIAADLVKMQLRGLGVGVGHHQGRAGITRGANRTEQISMARAKVGGLSRTGAGFGPYPCPPGLLTNAHFILKPDLHSGVWGERRPDIGDFAREVFLKAAVASAFRSWGRGRAVICEKPGRCSSLPTRARVMGDTPPP